MVIGYICNMKIDDLHKMKFKSEQQKAIINVRITSNAIGGIQNNFMTEFGLSMAQFNVLRILRGAKTPISIHVVKERMIEVSPNTTRLIDKLIDKGLVNRIRCEKDKRIIYVEITQKGLNLLAKIDEKLESDNFFSTGLTDEEAIQLNGLLEKLRSEWLK